MTSQMLEKQNKDLRVRLKNATAKMLLEGNIELFELEFKERASAIVYASALRESRRDYDRFVSCAKTIMDDLCRIGYKNKDDGDLFEEELWSTIQLLIVNMDMMHLKHPDKAQDFRMDVYQPFADWFAGMRFMISKCKCETIP